MTALTYVEAVIEYYVQLGQKRIVIFVFGNKNCIFVACFIEYSKL